jgi:hypothetical protein
MKKIRTMAEMSGIISRFRSSGQSVVEFCRKERIGEHSLRYWIRKERSLKNSPSKEKQQRGFEQITVKPERLVGVEVYFPSGLKIILRDMPQQELSNLLWEIDRKGRV